ncbi:MAG: hypothetical protein NTZ97_01890 [Candidatus Moranbacteria bacterium]|nr:hypothetical protein [Candidatus Moranbacteria bacterium]
MKKPWKIIKDSKIESKDKVLRLKNPFKKKSAAKKIVRILKGTELMKRVEEMIWKPAGRAHAMKALKNNIIPEDWKNYYLLFPGTIWEDENGDLHIMALYWDGRKWNRIFEWVEDEFLDHCRIVVTSRW